MQSSLRQQPLSYSPYCSTGSDVSCVNQKNDVWEGDSKIPGEISQTSNLQMVELTICFEKRARTVDKQNHSELDNNQEVVFDSVNELNQL